MRSEEIKLLHPFYVALNQRSVGLPPVQIPEPLDTADEADLDRLQQWFSDIDKYVEAYHLREVLQTGFSLDADGLIALIARHQAAGNKEDRHRDKLDFLLTQYLALAIPPDMQTPEVEDAAGVLEPILGDRNAFAWMHGLEACITQLNSCHDLKEFMDRGMFERGRELKVAAGEVYFSAPAQLAFTRFNFLLRRGFIRLLFADLHAIRHALAELESLHASEIDATAAGLSASEPIRNIATLCTQWEKPFQGKHSDKQWIEQVVQLGTLLPTAIEQARIKNASAASKLVADPAMELPSETPVALEADNVFAAHATRTSGEAAPSASPVEQHSSAMSQAQSSRAVSHQAKPDVSEEGKPRPAAKKTVVSAPPQTEEDSAESEAESAAAPVSAPAPVEPNFGIELDLRQTEIAAQLQSADAGKLAVVHVGNAKISMPSWLVAAFQGKADATAVLLRRAATVTAMLSAAQAAGETKDGDATDAGLVNFARSELVRLQEKVKHARQSKDPGAVNLSACVRSLTAVLEQAETRARSKTAKTRA